MYGKLINNIRYVDDTVGLANSTEELHLMKRIQRAIVEIGLNLNQYKTKWMLVRKTQQPVLVNSTPWIHTNTS